MCCGQEACVHRSLGGWTADSASLSLSLSLTSVWDIAHSARCHWWPLESRRQSPGGLPLFHLALASLLCQSIHLHLLIGQGFYTDS